MLCSYPASKADNEETEGPLSSLEPIYVTAAAISLHHQSEVIRRLPHGYIRFSGSVRGAAAAKAAAAGERENAREGEREREKARRMKV